jgi:hypothetical protein
LHPLVQEITEKINFLLVHWTFACLIFN